jgi:hypothetical protein
MRYALGYKAANPELRVSLLLNGATAVELAHLCPFIEEVFPVPFTRFEEVDGDPLKALASVPRSWDWVVENHRVHEDSHGTFRGFQAFFEAAHQHIQPRHPLGVAGQKPPDYLPDQQLRLDLPIDARQAAAARLGGVEAIAARRVVVDTTSLPVDGVMGADPYGALGPVPGGSPAPDREAHCRRPHHDADQSRRG